MTQAFEPPLTGGWLFVATDMPEAVRLRISSGEAVILTQVGPATAAENEDAAAVVSGDSDSALLAVAHGFNIRGRRELRKGPFPWQAVARFDTRRVRGSQP